MNVASNFSRTDDGVYPACLDYAAGHTPECIREISEGAEANPKKERLRNHNERVSEKVK